MLTAGGGVPKCEGQPYNEQNNGRQGDHEWTLVRKRISSPGCNTSRT